MTHSVDERVVLMAERPMTMGMFAPGSFVPDPLLIVGLRPDDLLTGDLVGERRVAVVFAFSQHTYVINVYWSLTQIKTTN